MEYLTIKESDYILVSRFISFESIFLFIYSIKMKFVLIVVLFNLPFILPLDMSYFEVIAIDV